MNTLQKALQEYLAMRRALGFQLLDAGPALSDFVSFLKRRRTSHITIRLALEWAQKPGAQPARWAHRLGFVRGFARYRSATDPGTEIPPWRLLPFRSKRARPYLYTDNEVRMLLKASLGLSPNNPLRKWTYLGLLGLLVVSGLRLSEVLPLRLSDVDLQNAVLTVRGTKFGKCRLVPLHGSTRRVLSMYKSRRGQYLKGQPTSDFFFVTKRGTRLDKNNVRGTFHALSRQIGLRGEFDSHGPRLHDFRQHADFLIMPTTRWKQQFGGARIVSGVGIIRSEAFEKRQQFVVRAVPCCFDSEWCSTRERFFLQTHICVEIHLCCLHGFVPQPEGYHGAVNSMLQKVHGSAVPAMSLGT